MRLEAYLPFLPKEQVDEELQKAFERGESVAKFLPFAGQHRIDSVLFDFVKRDGKIPPYMYPFCSQEALSKLVDMYTKGEIEINAEILPFLDKESIKKMYDYDVANGNDDKEQDEGQEDFGSGWKNFTVRINSESEHLTEELSKMGIKLGEVFSEAFGRKRGKDGHQGGSEDNNDCESRDSDSKSENQNASSDSSQSDTEED